jgi:hypothetical protein
MKPVVHSDAGTLLGSIYQRETNPAKLFGDEYLTEEFQRCCSVVLAKLGADIAVSLDKCLCYPTAS